MSSSNTRPLVYENDLITTSPCIPTSAPLLLGAHYLKSRRNYLYWSSKPGTLLAGANNTVTDSSNVSILSGTGNTISSSQNSSLLGTTGVFLSNSKNTVVAGLDYTGLLPQIDQFDQSLITGTLVTTKSARIGSLIDQGSSVVTPGFCPPFQCIFYPPGSDGCLCGEKGDVFTHEITNEKMDAGSSSSCRSSGPPFVPIFTTYGDAHVKGQLAVDTNIYCGPIYSSSTVLGQSGSFTQLCAGSFYGSRLDIPLGSVTATITGTSFTTYVTGAPLAAPLFIVLDGSTSPFILGQTITFKDNTLEYAPGTRFSILIGCLPGVFMETRDFDGNLERRDGGPYIISTTGGSVTFVFDQRDVRASTWLITSEVKGNPRFVGNDEAVVSELGSRSETVQGNEEDVVSEVSGVITTDRSRS